MTIYSPTMRGGYKKKAGQLTRHYTRDLRFCITFNVGVFGCYKLNLKVINSL